jgi:hypothetical protein
MDTKSIFKIGVFTNVDIKESLITQIVSTEIDGMVKVLGQEVLDLKEAGIRDALIKLGWISPVDRGNK